MRLTTVAAVLSLALPLAGAAKESTEEKAKKPRMAILDFPPASGGWSCSGWNQSEHRMSNALRDLFTTEISDRSKRKVRIVERERLKDIREELSFEQSGEVDGSSAQKIGKLLGVRYILSGKITRFACKKTEAGTGWGVGHLVGSLTGSGTAGSSRKCPSSRPRPSRPSSSAPGRRPPPPRRGRRRGPRRSS